MPANATAGCSGRSASEAGKRSDAAVTEEVREGEGGWFFDEIKNLVEPTERLHMGEQHCGERPDTMSGQAR